MNVRMKDIAKDPGVSLITISKVLRNHPDIGEETRERVLARVKELDYRPNFAARSLVTGRSYLVGLVVLDLLHPFQLKSTPKAGNCGDAARVDCARIDAATHGQGHFKQNARKRQA